MPRMRRNAARMSAWRAIGDACICIDPSVPKNMISSWKAIQRDCLGSFS